MMVRRSENGPHETAIEVTGVCKSFGARLALKQIELQLAPGAALCLCGPNGAGKSTLLRIVAGLLRPTRGRACVCGHDISLHADAAKTCLGVISHKSMLYDDLTPAENLSFYARLYGVANPRRRVDELLEHVGLASYRHDKTSILSRGMLQRLAIARALVHQPSVLLADEPFTGLDAPSAEHLTETLRNFAHAGGAVMMTTHDTAFGLRCCDRVAVLDQGRLIFAAATSQIDADRFAADYLSYARMKP